jgi:hypothetical protein
MNTTDLGQLAEQNPILPIGSQTIPAGRWLDVHRLVLLRRLGALAHVIWRAKDAEPETPPDASRRTIFAAESINGNEVVRLRT